MRRRRGGGVRGCGRAGPPAPAPSARCRRRRRLPHALGTSAGVRGHGAAGCARGAAPASRPQASPFHGMGEAAENTGDGGTNSRDGGARRESAVGSRGGKARPASKHTAAGRRVRAGCPSAVTSPLSASRVDEKFSASTEQVRERRAGVGGGAAGRRGCGCGRGRGCGCGPEREEGRAAAEGDALVGPHGRARAGRVRAAGAALRDGAAPRATLAALALAHAAPRRVTSPGLRPSLSYHAYIPLSGRSDSPRCTRVPEYYRLGIYLFGTRGLG